MIKKWQTICGNTVERITTRCSGVLRIIETVLAPPGAAAPPLAPPAPLPPPPPSPTLSLQTKAAIAVERN